MERQSHFKHGSSDPAFWSGVRDYGISDLRVLKVLSQAGPSHHAEGYRLSKSRGQKPQETRGENGSEACIGHRRRRRETRSPNRPITTARSLLIGYEVLPNRPGGTMTSFRR